MHELGVIHRDIKPSNILINRECLVKVADFSLARHIARDDEDGHEDHKAMPMTDYVAARWYRAPEVLLGSTHYSERIDLWGLGCILAEMYLNRPLFPGSSTLNQISRIIEVTGTPTEEELSEIHSPVARTIFENLKLNRGPKRDLRDIIPRAPEEAIDLIEKCLTFRPSQRINAETAFQHEYISYFRKKIDKEEETKIANEQGTYIEIPLAEDKTYKVQEYKNEIYKMLIKKNREHREA